MSYNFYIKHYEKYRKTYPDKLCILMELGSFYDIYEHDDNPGYLLNIHNLLNCALTCKNKKEPVSHTNPNFVGFPSVALSKYVPILLDNNFTVVLLTQKPENTSIREVTQILSPGTDLDNTSDSNNIVSVFIEFLNSQLFIGLSSIDFTTGNSTIYQTYSTINDDQLSLDEVFKFITSNSPKEIIISGINLHKTIITSDFLRKTLDINHIVSHIFVDDIDPVFCNITYQNDFLRKIYNPGMLSPIEFLDLEKFSFATVSFLKLLQFAYEHNEKIIHQLKKPTIILENSQLILLNNTINQLNLLGDTSVFSIINETSTVLGKRLLKQRLLNPIKSISTLNTRYTHIESMSPVYKQYESFLKHIVDIDRLHRRIKLGTIYPIEFVNLHHAYDSVIQLDKLCKSSKNSLSKLKLSNLSKFKKLIKSYSSSFNLKDLEIVNLQDMFSTSFLNPGINSLIDEIQSNIDHIHTTFLEKSKHFSSLIDPTKDNLIKLEISDKDGIYLSLTSIRSKVLAKHTQDISFKHLKNTSKIISPELSNLSDKYLLLQSKLKINLKLAFQQILTDLTSSFSNTFDSVVSFVAELDLVKSSAKSSFKLNLHKPEISSSDSSFVTSTNLRHPLVESINKSEKYIPNDISLDNHNSGILLYGVNSSGKSSTLKALGINIILAQAGFFVSSDTFLFSPFEYLISRIQGGDDILKGHSSFVVEMLELRCILNRSNDKTLVLGDELCRGTEHISAISIVASTILDLSNRNTKFIFATHLHELTRLPDIISIPNVDFYHLSVLFDESSDKLIYHRKLQKGSGSDMYGLEVAKSMHLHPTFILKALEIRRNLLNINNNILSPKKSRYNSSVFVSDCSICHSIDSLDTHHINFQCTADSNGIIDHFHKNNSHNLVVLCKSCHNKVHNQQLFIAGYQQTSNGLELNYSTTPI